MQCAARRVEYSLLARRRGLGSIRPAGRMTPDRPTPEPVGPSLLLLGNPFRRALTMLTRQLLDRLASQGCQHTDHDPEDCQNDGIVFLHCRHHPETGFDFYYCIDYLFICPESNCKTKLSCQGEHTTQQLGSHWSAFPGPFHFHSKCHPDSTVWASYRLKSGIIEIFCRSCHTLVGQIDLDRTEEESE